MQQTLAMPKLGLTMTEGLVAEWRRAPGESFAAGDVLVVIETDKIASDVEAPAAGRLQTILVAAGRTVPVGTPLAHWSGEAGMGPAEEAVAALRASPAVMAALPMASAAPPPAPPPSATSGHRIIATPYARRLAGERGVALEAVAGSGPGGRIRAADVPPAAPVQALIPDQSDAAMAFAAPGEHSLLAEIDAAALLDWRARLPAASRSGLGSLVLYVAARVLARLDGTATCGVADGAAVPASVAMQGLSVFVAALREPVPATPGHGLLLANAGRGGIRLFAPARPAGCSALLGLGGLRDGRLGLALCADAVRWPAAEAAAYLERLCAGLEDPRTLLL